MLNIGAVVVVDAEVEGVEVGGGGVAVTVLMGFVPVVETWFVAGKFAVVTSAEVTFCGTFRSVKGKILV